MSQEKLKSEINQLKALGFDEEAAALSKDIPLEFQKEVPEPEQEDVSLDSTQAHEAAKSNLNFLAALAVPGMFKFLFPDHFIAIWQWLLEWTGKIRAFPQLAIGFPRGFAKTTFIKFYILFCILFTNKKFILIINNTASLAEATVSDVVNMLDEPNIKKLFGNWRIGLQKDTQALKIFSFRGRNIVLAALGVGGSLRGFNLKFERPDVMIFDDIQSREEAESQVQSDAIEKWMYGTAMKAKSPFGCMFIFVGNMYPTKFSMLKKLKANPTWLKFIVGGILADGTSLWEELQPITQLMQEFQNDLASGHPEIFYSEVLNDEDATVNHLIDISALPEFPFLNEKIHLGNFIIIDPADDKPTSDAVSIGYFEVHGDMKPCLMEVDEGRYSPGETIHRTLKMALEKGCRIIGVESNAYQRSLLYWFTHVTQQLGLVGFEFLELYSGTKAKRIRIVEMFRSLQKGEEFYHPSTSAHVNPQISQYNPLKADNTDGILDLLAYAPKMIELYGPLIGAMTIIQEQDSSSLRVLENNCVY